MAQKCAQSRNHIQQRIVEKIAHNTNGENTLEGIGNQHQHRSLGTDGTENVCCADILAAVVTDINTVKGLHQP